MAGSASFASPLLAEARRRGIVVAFDPSSFSLIRAHRPARLLDEVGPLDVLLCNEDEARALVPDGPLEGLLAHTAVAVVKRGGEGATAIHAGGVVSAAAQPIVVADTTGAGDAFDAAFLVEYHSVATSPERSPPRTASAPTSPPGSGHKGRSRD